jgi:hypothetical protein
VPPLHPPPLPSLHLPFTFPSPSPPPPSRNPTRYLVRTPTRHDKLITNGCIWQKQRFCWCLSARAHSLHKLGCHPTCTSNHLSSIRRDALRTSAGYYYTQYEYRNISKCDISPVCDFQRPSLDSTLGALKRAAAGWVINAFSLHSHVLRLTAKSQCQII